MIEPCRLSAKEAAGLIERGELSAEKFARSCLERIRGREPQVQAWKFLDEELALSQTKASKGPLFGVPVGVKDIFDTHDMPTEYGSRIYAGHRPRSDSAPVALTRRAGGTILGKTVTTEFATMVPAHTRHPLDPKRTPGGSSSGSAASVADFMVPLAFGTQTAGSTIRPGSYCGIAAFKPTFNLIPRAGVKPGGDSLDTVGVYGRTVADVAFFARALTGLSGLEGTMERPRVAMCRTHEWGSVQPEMAKAFDEVRRILGADEIELPKSFQPLRKAQQSVLWYEVAHNLADEYTRFPEMIAPSLRERCAAGFAMDPAEYVAAQKLAVECRARFSDAIDGYDVIVAPAATGEAPVGLHSTGDVAMNVVWTLMHTPSVCVPAARSANRMPLGMQAIGRIGDDGRTLACAAWLEKQLKENAS